MSLCTICYYTKGIRQPCNCEFCGFCLLTYFETSQTNEIPCPTVDCQYNYTVDDILNVCWSKNHKEKIMDILFRRYLRTTETIRPCPMSDCDNYGYIDMKKCHQDLQCNLCGMEWSDSSLQPSYLTLIKQLVNIRRSIMNQYFYFYYTRKCPKCDSRIEKNGGCAHITCRICKYEFCWICKAQHNNHNQLNCSQHENAIDCILTYFIVITIASLGISWYLFVGGIFIIQFLLLLVPIVMTGRFTYLKFNGKATNQVYFLRILTAIGLLVLQQLSQYIIKLILNSDDVPFLQINFIFTIVAIVWAFIAIWVNYGYTLKRALKCMSVPLLFADWIIFGYPYIISLILWLIPIIHQFCHKYQQCEYLYFVEFSAKYHTKLNKSKTNKSILNFINNGVNNIVSIIHFAAYPLLFKFSDQFITILMIDLALLFYAKHSKK